MASGSEFRNLSAVLKKKGVLVLEDAAVPIPGVNEVQLRIQAVGICGSDVHYWKNGGIGDHVINEPLILGHESSGIVCSVGERVTSLKIGDRVAIEPGVPCGQCTEYCRRGRYNLCRKVNFMSCPPIHGALRRYHCHPAEYCFKLPDEMTMEEGALIEPLSVCVHACRIAGVSLGNNVLVCGAGTIGLLSMLTAKAMGASLVCMTDIVDRRLTTAKKFGADFTVNVNSKDCREIAGEIVSAMGGEPDATIECSGATSSIQTAILTTAPGGTVSLVGLGSPDASLPVLDAIFREITIKGSYRYANCYPTAIELVSSGKIDLKSLISHRFHLEEAIEAFEVVKTGNARKVMIICNHGYE